MAARVDLEGAVAQGSCLKSSCWRRGSSGGVGGASSEMRIYLQGLDQGLLTGVRVLKAVLVPVGAAKIRGECMGWLHSHPRSQNVTLKPSGETADPLRKPGSEPSPALSGGWEEGSPYPLVKNVMI